jgi:PPOX class probable F420-dependent enzyme
MVKRRDQIKMTPEEVEAYLDAPRSLNVASFNHDGSIHLVAMWFAMDGGDVVFWTYGKSQKILNLQRDPRVTCLVEDGDAYDKLRGVELVGTAEVITDWPDILDIGIKVVEKYQMPVTEETKPFIEQVGAKRFGVRIKVDKIVSWDHTKVEGY